jgi:hypothetical protein
MSEKIGPLPIPQYGGAAPAGAKPMAPAAPPIEAEKRLLNDLNDPTSAATLRMQMSEYTSRMQLMSNVLKMLEDTNKAIIGNIR